MRGESKGSEREGRTESEMGDGSERGNWIFAISHTLEDYALPFVPRLVAKLPRSTGNDKSVSPSLDTIYLYLQILYVAMHGFLAAVSSLHHHEVRISGCDTYLTT